MDSLNVRLGAYTWSELAEFAQDYEDDQNAAWQFLIDDGHEVPMEAYENDPQAYGEFVSVQSTVEATLGIMPHLELEAC